MNTTLAAPVVALTPVYSQKKNQLLNMITIRSMCRSVLALLVAGCSLGASAQTSLPVSAQTKELLTSRPNLAIVATASSSQRFGQPLTSINDGMAPIPHDRLGAGGGNRQVQRRTQYWVQYEWKQPVHTKEIGAFWYNYNNAIRLPEAYHIGHRNGTACVPD